MAALVVRVVSIAYFAFEPITLYYFAPGRIDAIAAGDQAAVDAACAIASSLGIDTAIFELLYVGEPADVPRPRLQRRDGWIWKQSVSTGIVVEEILEAAERQQPDLIVMATEWRTGFLDALRGSTTERILRRTICALLAVPVYEPLA